VAGTLIISPLAGFIIAMYYVRRHSRIAFGFAGIRERARKMLSFSLNISGATFVDGIVNNFAVLLLGVFALSSVVGNFTIAYKISSIISIMLGSVSIVLVRLFSSAALTEKRRKALGSIYNYSVFIGLLIAAPMVTYLIDFAHAFVTSVFPAEPGAVLLIPLLGIATLLGIIGTYATSLVISFGEVRRFLKYGLITSAVQFALLIVLVPTLKVYGIIIGYYLAGSLMLDYLYITHLRRSMHIDIEMGRLLRIIVASAVLGIIMYPITLIPIRTTFQLLIGIAAGLLLYPPLLAKAGAVGKEELDVFGRISKSVDFVGVALGIFVSYTTIFV
jgi:O-antigen/teichoic acid export membrane protein